MSAIVSPSVKLFSPVVDINQGGKRITRSRFATGNGSATVFKLLYGAVPNQIYRTNWQGTQQLYSTARTNYATNSQAFNLWTANTGLSVTADATVAPDGTSTADLLAATGGLIGYASSVMAVASATPLKIKCWVKNIDSAQSVLYVRTAVDAGRVAIFWSGSSITSLGVSSGASNAQFTSYPNGWYLVSFDVTTTELNQTLRIYPDAFITNKSIYAWGYQALSSDGSYIKTDATAVTVTDYTGTNPITLAQTTNPAVNQHANMARTNLAIRSEEFDNVAYGGTTAGVTFGSGANTVVAPNGTTTAERATFAVTTSYRYQNIAALGALTGRTFTVSCWLKSDAKATIGLRIAGQPTGSDQTKVTVNLTPSWTRYSATRTFTSADTTIDIGLDNRVSGGGDGIAGDVDVWGWQVEESAVMTPYIPTTAAAVKVVDISPTGGNGNGGTATFELSPAGTTPTVTALYKTDWQGTQLLYSTARTNLLFNSKWAGGTPPTSWVAQLPGSISAGIPDVVGDGTDVALTFTASASQPFVAYSPTLTIGASYIASVNVDSVVGSVIAANLMMWNDAMTGATVTYPVCPANPSGGASGVIQAGRLDLRVDTGTLATGARNLRIGCGCSSLATATAKLSRPQVEVGTSRTSFMGSPTGSTLTVTDYTLVGNTATLSPAPAVGSTITWDGSYVGGLGVNNTLSWSGISGSLQQPILINGGSL